ncbi:unnamed protein product [Didymodactylos carnosus]|uniref:Apple domain-containing protein n=1 Tax=Didymodactylos carnosus TaxID=1234261 RepID=A0A815VSR6_9BILA|nr:unnamed protein product [Didymodactylos carnosus]CAF1536089.1 unnamed protein product [Didymodactylos carnosus]CAF3866297.1 unnamed protein product [Didymodactylos carnosus]CAF4395895.1 unnamed protein product [Didymodactylos carnosus]
MCIFQNVSFHTLDFGISILSTTDGTEWTNIGLLTRSNITYMENWDIPGWDYADVSNIAKPSECQAACDNDRVCKSWSFVMRDQTSYCYLKSGVPLPVKATQCTSGVKVLNAQDEQLVWIYIDRTQSSTDPEAEHSPYFGSIWFKTHENYLNINEDKWF